MAKEEWGLDGYGSMKGLIRLRSPGEELEPHEHEDEEDGESSESDVEEHVEIERRLDHDLSCFEMIYPNHSADYNNVLENLILKESLFLIERELGDLRRGLQSLERQNNGEAVANESDSETVDNNVEIVVMEKQWQIVAESKHKKSDRDLQEKEDKKHQDVDMKEVSARLIVENDELSFVDVSMYQGSEASHMDDEMNV
ncbi:PREDICTED: uncharacterized protein LOC109146982 [Ipomoea nil]|uniref:uncharacterized protein LOC109146982 n=1 Tax=Ipomoea nil TaxID=35883 RepID=UPI000901B24E|nr:PREDICTED: uncharacterized protein LOC109146982 [Ipomoea nil]